MELTQMQRARMLRRYGFRSSNASYDLIPPDRQALSTTLILFDWDDTLFPTTAMVHNKPRDRTLCEEHNINLCFAVSHLLNLTRTLGRVMIVTNARAAWVDHTSRTLIPEMAALLAGIPIVSARDLFEANHPGDPILWKCEAFALFKENSRQIANLVSIGDSEPEMQAVASLAKLYHTSFVKTVRFRSLPTMPELIKQLELLESKLPQIVSYARNLKISMVRTPKCKITPETETSLSPTLSPTSNSVQSQESTP